MRFGREPLPANQVNEQISADQAAACFAYPDKRSPTNACVPLAQVPILPAISTADVFLDAVFKGIVTGSNVNKPPDDYTSADGCVPYGPKRRADNSAPENKLECRARCTNPIYDTVAYTADLEKGRIESYRHFQRIDGEHRNDMVNLMMTEIETNGPITSNMNAFEDVDAYAQAKVILKDHGLPINRANHVVRIIGWGCCKKLMSSLHIGKPDSEIESAIKSKSKTIQDTTKCWIVANSWGVQGMMSKIDKDGKKMAEREMREIHSAGFFLIEIGSNVLNIEMDISAPIIALSDDACQRSKFGTGTIDAVSWRDIRHPEAGFLLHQGICTKPVKVVIVRNGDGKVSVTITADGHARPTAKIMVGAPEVIVMSEIILTVPDMGKPSVVVAEQRVRDTMGEGAACEPVGADDPRQACRFRARDPQRPASHYKDPLATAYSLSVATNTIKSWIYVPVKPTADSKSKTEPAFMIKANAIMPSNYLIKGRTLEAMGVGKISSMLTLDGETVLAFATDKNNANHFIALVLGNADHTKNTVEIISEPVSQDTIFLRFD